MSKHTIAQFEIVDGHHKFTATNSGKHTIAILGGFSAKAKGAFTVFSKDTGAELMLKTTLPYMDYYYGVRCVTIYSFHIDVPVNYELRIRNALGIEVRKSRLSLMSLFESPVPRLQAKVLIMFNGI